MKGKLDEPLALFIEETRQQRAATILRDVAYVIEARFELLDDSDPVAKHYNVFKRRAERGQYFHHPYLGCREFACDFDWIDGPIPESELTGEQDLGYHAKNRPRRLAGTKTGNDHASVSGGKNVGGIARIAVLMFQSAPP